MFEIKQRVPAELTLHYEQLLSRYPRYGPGRQLVLGNIEEVYATVSR